MAVSIVGTSAMVVFNSINGLVLCSEDIISRLVDSMIGRNLCWVLKLRKCICCCKLSCCIRYCMVLSNVLTLTMFRVKVILVCVSAVIACNKVV